MAPDASPPTPKPPPATAPVTAPASASTWPPFVPRLPPSPDATRTERLAATLAHDCATALAHARDCLRHRVATSGRERFRDASQIARTQWPAVAAAADAIALAAFGDLAIDPLNASPIMRVTNRAERIVNRLMAYDGTPASDIDMDLRRVIELALFDAVIRINNMRKDGRIPAPDPHWRTHAARRLASSARITDHTQKDHAS